MRLGRDVVRAAVSLRGERRGVAPGKEVPDRAPGVRDEIDDPVADLGLPAAAVAAARAVVLGKRKERASMTTRKGTDGARPLEARRRARVQRIAAGSSDESEPESAAAALARAHLQPSSAVVELLHRLVEGAGVFSHIPLEALLLPRVDDRKEVVAVALADPEQLVGEVLWRERRGQPSGGHRAFLQQPRCRRKHERAAFREKEAPRNCAGGALLASAATPVGEWGRPHPEIGVNKLPSWRNVEDRVHGFHCEGSVVDRRDEAVPERRDAEVQLLEELREKCGNRAAPRRAALRKVSEILRNPDDKRTAASSES